MVHSNLQNLEDQFNIIINTYSNEVKHPSIKKIKCKKSVSAPFIYLFAKLIENPKSKVREKREIKRDHHASHYKKRILRKPRKRKVPNTYIFIKCNNLGENRKRLSFEVNICIIIHTYLRIYVHMRQNHHNRAQNYVNTE